MRSGRTETTRADIHRRGFRLQVRLVALAAALGVGAMTFGSSSSLAIGSTPLPSSRALAAHSSRDSRMSPSRVPKGSQSDMRSVRQHFTDYMDSLQQAKLTASDGSTKDLFGGSVAVSGSTAVVGSPNKNTHTGAAYVFVRAGGTWSEQAELIASDGQSGDAFGGAVAISGSTVLVGAPDKNYYRGAVYVFIRSHGAWSQQAELFAPDAACCDEFGFSVAISGQSALVGAPFKNSYMGKAYVFVRSGGTWAPRAELHALNRATYDYFGYSVAISGFTAVVGSPGHAHSGAAFVFVHSEIG